MSVEVVTFGCRLNSYESEVIKDNALKAGLEDAIIFNTCAVTAEAERQARQAIRRARKTHPNSKIIVTGCSAQVHPQTYSEMGEVDQVIGNAEKLNQHNYLDTGHSEKVRVNDIMSVKETALHMVTSFEGRARGFLQVQNGCDHRCTFCIIPFGRGPSRSVPLGEIITQARMLVESGYNEIVITGVDVSDYGKDLPGMPSLGQMLRRLLALVPELKRIRLSSIDAVEVDDDLYRLIADEPRLMPHLHLSLQSGDDMILKRMKRRHSRKDAIDFCQRVRHLRPDVVFGADIITGFPTETEAMFQNTLNIIDEAGLTYLHVFPYSARSGTPAARMPQLPKDIRKERAERLRMQGEQRTRQYYASWIGKQTKGVIERGNIVRTDHFVPVHIDGETVVGSIAQIAVTGTSNNKLHAEIVL